LLREEFENSDKAVIRPEFERFESASYLMTILMSKGNAFSSEKMAFQTTIHKTLNPLILNLGLD